MRIVVTGASGMFGGDIAEVLSKAHDVVAFRGRAQLDLSKGTEVVPVLSESRPDVIVHAAAWRDVDRCEREPEEAFLNNTLATRYVALAAARAGCKLVYISTDAVFDGQKCGPYHEFDETNPINVYGRTKLASEWEVKRLVPRHFIIRVPLLFGHAGPAGTNLILKTVGAARTGGEMVAASDQATSPTYTIHAANVIGRLLETDLYGTYHVANGGCGSRWDVTVEILRLAGCTGARVKAVPSAELGRPAARQRYSVIHSLGLKDIMGSTLPDWRQALKECIERMKGEYPGLFPGA